ncbi:hypothetical protein [Janthinobacterium sp.]|uniref:hypothetical protein n=1 Tax=Janthinobacterium sp. TaxID=1871054 RepID=UPI00293D577D|nr:hypothetical protein [Janthinobacterium sp.]
MPIDHGDSPLDVAATWTVIAKNLSKNQVPLYNQGQSSTKRNKNNQAFVEIEKLTNQGIDHGSSEPLAVLYRNTTTKLFKRGLLDFKASVVKRMEATLYIELAKNAENLTISLEELLYNYDRRLRQQESITGNKRKVGPTKLAPRKRQKKSQKQHAAFEKATVITQAPQKPHYTFWARDSMFPDPSNCASFNNQPKEGTPADQSHQLSATASKIKIKKPGPLTTTTHKFTVFTALRSNPSQQSCLPRSTGSNLKNTSSGKNQSTNIFAGGQFKGLPTTENPRRATKFKNLPHKETSTECALKKPPNIECTLQGARKNKNKYTASNDIATHGTNQFSQPATKIPATPKTALSEPHEASLSGDHHSAANLKKLDNNNKIKTKIEQKIHATNAIASITKFGSAASSTKIFPSYQAQIANHRQATPNATKKYPVLKHYGATKNSAEHQDVQTSSKLPTATSPTIGTGTGIIHHPNSLCSNYQADNFHANSPRNDHDTNLHVNSPITLQVRTAATHFSILGKASDNIKRRDRDTITHHSKTYNKRPPRQDQPALSHEE